MDSFLPLPPDLRRVQKGFGGWREELSGGMPSIRRVCLTRNRMNRQDRYPGAGSAEVGGSQWINRISDMTSWAHFSESSYCRHKDAKICMYINNRLNDWRKTGGVIDIASPHITKRRLTSAARVSPGVPFSSTADQLTKGMAAAQLWLLSIFSIEFRPNGVEQLQITLLGPLS